MRETVQRTQWQTRWWWRASHLHTLCARCGAADAMVGASVAKAVKATMLERRTCLIFMKFFLSNDDGMRCRSGANRTTRHLKFQTTHRDSAFAIGHPDRELLHEHVAQTNSIASAYRLSISSSGSLVMNKNGVPRYASRLATRRLFFLNVKKLSCRFDRHIRKFLPVNRITRNTLLATCTCFRATHEVQS